LSLHADRAYGRNVNTLKKQLQLLLSSRLLKLGAVVAVVSFSTYYLLWSGNLSLLARLADDFNVGTHVFPFLAGSLLVSLCLALIGIIIGILRLCLSWGEHKQAKQSAARKGV
jgi:hypothetical protein